jgi:hypothetical protein
MLTENDPVGELVREMETAFTSGSGVQTSKYVHVDLYEDINKIYAYLESKHTFGDTDSLGREKPFFNISKAARNIHYRATDIDRKNINIKPSKESDTVAAFLATIHLQKWMRKSDFGTFLNTWGIELAGFNDAVVKFVESDGDLHCMVVPWSRLIVDPINFNANPKIEILELTEAELYQRKGYDQDMVEKLCDALESREQTDGTKKDSKSNYIKLYEVHGNLPLSYLTGKEKDEDTYVQQMHVISFVASKEKGKYDDFTLYSGKEATDPYMLTSLLPSTDGSISLDGSVKTLFEAQWMVNHSVKQIKDTLDIASKLIFQTSDATFVGRNVLSAIESGDIMIHKVNEPLTKVNNDKTDITSQMNFGSMWKSLGSEQVGISESMLGNTAPSGTAWRQVEALLQESHDLFELMTENKGLDVERMLRKFVIPFVKKKMDTKDEIAATLEDHQISKIDAIYIPKAAVRRFNDRTFDQLEQAASNPNMPLPTPFDPQVEQDAVKQDLGAQGNQRFFTPDELGDKTWKEIVNRVFDEGELEVDITGEAIDKQTMFTTLNTALQVVANPTFANNPAAQLLVNKALSATGVVSPIELSNLPKPQPVPPAVGQPVQ